MFAPNVIFDLMTQCWEKEPKERPNLSIIERKLREIIEDKIQHRYLELVNNDAATLPIHVWLYIISILEMIVCYTIIEIQQIYSNQVV